MTVYSKFCVMCNRQYLTVRISTAYCSKKCANRARGLPASLKEQLLARNNKFNLSMLSHMDRDGDITERQIVEFDPMNRRVNKKVMKSDERILLEAAKILARQRGIDPDRKQPDVDTWNRSAVQSTEDNSKNIMTLRKDLTDPEMKEFKLDEDTGFGSHVLDEEMANKIHHLSDNEIPVLNVKEKEELPQTQPQQPIGLRKFGSLKGKQNEI